MSHQGMGIVSSRGVCLIAYGEKAEREADLCIRSLRRYHDWPYMVATNSNGPNSTNRFLPKDYTDVQKSRWSKVTLDLWSPFDETLYLDADTRAQGDLSAGFDMLCDGWDMVITPSSNQADQNMWHVAPDEREYTYLLYQCADVLQLQGGVFWLRKSEAVTRFFEAWRMEWQRWRQFDQAALLRALIAAPIRLHLLGRPFNGGAVVAHNHGRAAA